MNRESTVLIVVLLIISLSGCASFLDSITRTIPPPDPKEWEIRKQPPKKRNKPTYEQQRADRETLRGRTTVEASKRPKTEDMTPEELKRHREKQVRTGIVVGLMILFSPAILLFAITGGGALLGT